MADIGVDVFAEWRVVPEDVVTLSVFPFSSRDRCSGIRFRRVLFGMEGRLGRMMLCLRKEMIVVC